MIDGPERYGASSFFETIPSSPSLRGRRLLSAPQPKKSVAGSLLFTIGAYGIFFRGRHIRWQMPRQRNDAWPAMSVGAGTEQKRASIKLNCARHVGGPRQVRKACAA
jgi:hypothetical protein